MRVFVYHHIIYALFTLILKLPSPYYILKFSVYDLMALKLSRIILYKVVIVTICFKLYF